MEKKIKIKKTIMIQNFSFHLIIKLLNKTDSSLEEFW